MSFRAQTVLIISVLLCIGSVCLGVAADQPEGKRFVWVNFGCGLIVLSLNLSIFLATLGD